MMIEQEGADCIVTIQGRAHKIKNCNALKLANTIWAKEGEKYTKEKMEAFGFGIVDRSTRL